MRRLKPTQHKRRRFLAAALAAVWTIGGGFNVAHADDADHHMSGHLNNPAAWMSGYDHEAMHDPSDPTMPFDCDMGTEGVVVAGAALPGAFGAGPGLAILAQQGNQGMNPEPDASPSPDMTVGGIDELGPFPDVEDDTLKEVTNNILCQCGCNLTVAACELAMVCDVSKKMKYDAAVLLADGMSPSQALDQFAEEYGEKVLAAPTKEGVNLVSWILPFAGLAAGMALVAWALVGWRKQAPETTEVAAPDIDPDVQARVDDEVNRGL